MKVNKLIIGLVVCLLCVQHGYAHYNKRNGKKLNVLTSKISGDVAKSVESEDLENVGTKKDVTQLSQTVPKSVATTASTIITTDNTVNWINCGPNKQPTSLNGSPDGTCDNTIRTTGADVEHYGIGVIHRIVIDPTNPQILFACSGNGGLFRMNLSDTKPYWENMGTDTGLPLSGVSCVAIEEDHPNDIWYVTTGNGINFRDLKQESIGVYRTINGGATWQPIGLDLAAQETAPYLMNKVVKVPGDPGHIFVATLGGLYECTNALDGTSYGDINGTPGFTEIFSGSFLNVDIVPGKTEIVASETTNSITNDPNTHLSIDTYDWSSGAKGSIDGNINGINNFPTNQNGHSINVAFSVNAPNEMFIRVKNNKVGEIFRYDFTTGVLTPKASIISKHGYLTAFAVSPTNANIVLWGNLNVHMGNNGLDGNTLNNADISDGKTHVDIRSLVFSPDGSTIWAGTDGGVFEYSVGDGSWSVKNDGLGVATLYNIGATKTGPIKILSGQQDDGTNLTTYNPSSGWSTQNLTTADGSEVVFDYENPDIMYYSFQDNNIFRSEDGGQKQLCVGSSIECPQGSQARNDFIINSKNPSILYAEKSGDYLQRTTDRGDNWESWSSVTGLGSIATCENPLYSNYLYAKESNVIYKSITGGGTSSSDWTTNTPPQNEQYYSVGKLYVDYFHPDILYDVVPDIAKNLVKIDTRTNSWSILASLPSDDITYLECLVQDKNTGDLYIGTTGGVYYMKFATTDLVRLAGNLPHVMVNDMDINYTYKKLIVGTEGRGIWMADLRCNEFSGDATLSGTIYSWYFGQTNNFYVDGQVAADQTVIFQAGNEIQFNPGFSTGSNVILHTNIDDCSVSTYYKNASSEISPGTNNNYEQEINKDHTNSNPKSEINVYPNPTSGRLFISSGNTDNCSLELFSFNGELVLHSKFVSYTELNLSSLPKGMYILKITSAKETTARKIDLQ